MIKELSPSHLQKVAAIADLRQNAASEVANLGLFTASYTMERLSDTVGERSGAVVKVMQVTKNSPLLA